MISLLKFLDGPWERVREYLRTDLEHIEAAFNQQKTATFDESNKLKPSAILGTSSADSRYVSNQGTNHSPLWDQVDLSNGVKKRLPFAHIVPATRPGILIGREGTIAGDLQEIVIGSGLQLTGRVLSASGGSGGGLQGEDGEDGLPGPPGPAGSNAFGTAYIPVSTGAEPLVFVSNGAGSPLLAPYTP